MIMLRPISRRSTSAAIRAVLVDRPDLVETIDRWQDARLARTQHAERAQQLRAAMVDAMEKSLAAADRVASLEAELRAAMPQPEDGDGLRIGDQVVTPWRGELRVEPYTEALPGWIAIRNERHPEASSQTRDEARRQLRVELGEPEGEEADARPF